MKTRIPHDERYTALLGRAVYAFAYYEWVVIYAVDLLRPGFVAEYSRGKRPHTSGRVAKKLKAAVEDMPAGSDEKLRLDLREAAESFEELVHRRNALVHAHPITHAGGDQILAFQMHPDRPTADTTWGVEEIEEFLGDVDRRCVSLSGVYRRLEEASAAA